MKKYIIYFWEKVTDFDMSALVPEEVVFDLEKYKSELFDELDDLKNKVTKFPEEYLDDNNKESSYIGHVT